MLRLTGYLRADGRFGCRNHVLLLPTVQCANRVVEWIAEEIPGAVPVPHVYGCTFGVAAGHAIERTLIGFGTHPNVYATLLVSLGCETVDAARVAARISESGKPVELLIIQERGGTAKTTEAGIRTVRQWMADAAGLPRIAFPFSSLVVGLECGGSDAFSGLSANAAVGGASDLFVNAGSTVILSEMTELIGAEHLLAERCVADDVRRALLAAVDSAERGFAHSSPQADGVYISPGNIAGGLTTIAEKSLGCVNKAGTSCVHEVLTYAQRPTRQGLVIMDTPGYDVSSVTGMVAGGAQVVLFTTGRGSPTGCPIAPVVKICSNTPTFTRLADDMDVDAGGILTGTTTIPDTAKAVFEAGCRAVNGELTKAEIRKHREFAIAAPSVYYCRKEAAAWE